MAFLFSEFQNLRQASAWVWGRTRVVKLPQCRLFRRVYWTSCRHREVSRQDALEMLELPCKETHGCFHSPASPGWGRESLSKPRMSVGPSSQFPVPLPRWPVASHMKNLAPWELPVGPLVRNFAFQYRGKGLMPGPGAEIPHAFNGQKRKIIQKVL